MTELPTGTVTILFTDIENSTQRWQQRPDDMRSSLAVHDELLGRVIVAHNGIIFKHTGDGIAAVFVTAEPAVRAAIEIQRRLQTDGWSGDDRLKVRIGLHTGEGVPRDGDYFGPDINKAARVMDVANGDQIAVSAATAELIQGFELIAQGEHQLKGIGSERLSLLTSADLVPDHRPLRTRTFAPSQGLPVIRPEFVGRTAEIAQVGKSLDQHRLVTLVGVGGVGKTLLAVEAADLQRERFSDGIVMCELAAVTNPESVPDELAQALGARQQPDMTLVESIANYLQDRLVLVLIDNCEHVLDATREMLSQLQATGASFLATSREPLRMTDEQVVMVAPLDASTDGVALFIARATERDTTFTVNETDRAVISEICTAVDGIPLAIELAAARARVLTPEELLARLEDRFRVLRGTRNHGRHSTLRDTVSWSYEQLTEAEARLFDRLSVFSGSFGLDAAEAVCADDDIVDGLDILDLVMNLLDKSMLVSESGKGRMRFRLLETLRQFGADALVESGHTGEYRKRHAAFYTDQIDSQADRLLTGKEAEIWDQMDQNWSNIRAAFETSLDDGNIDQAVSITTGLMWWAIFAMQFEALGFAERLLGRSDLGEHPRKGELLGLRAMWAYFTVDERAADFAAEGLTLDPTDPTGTCRAALCSVYLNNLLSADDSDQLTRDWLENVVFDDGPNHLWAEGMRAFHLGTYTDDPLAAVHASNARSIANHTESASASALAGWAEGMAYIRSDPKAADKAWADGLDAARSLSRSHLLTHLITGLQLHISAAHGDLASTISLCRSTLSDAIDQHYLAGTSHLFGVAGICLARAGRPEAGATLLAAMVNNGHRPRSNARRALSRALGQDVETYQVAGQPMDLRTAGQFALDQLDAAMGAFTTEIA
jgi:predicted ATPase/class 3 adenylate cyclase